MSRGKKNTLLFASSEKDANLYYATRFLAPDPFALLEIRGRKYLLMNDLELDRARARTKNISVLSASRWRSQYAAKHRKRTGPLDGVIAFLESRRVKHLEVPANFPIRYADLLRKRGFKITPRSEPFYPKRTVKTREEIKAVTKVLRATEKAMTAAIQIIRRSAIRKGSLIVQGKPLTAEWVKSIIHHQLVDSGCLAKHSIVACGRQGIDPHHEGTGPLYAHQPIILDIFPQDISSHYFADLSRTVVRGKASPKLKRMYAAVEEAQTIAMRLIRGRADASKIHRAVQKRFEALGFPAGEKNGRQQGFFHGTGHGVGLEIHEPPCLGPYREKLKAGNIITVEPGLYYEDTGGLRLEDMVVVTKKSCMNLTRMPKILEV